MEFSLTGVCICDGEIIQKIKESWAKYAPIILQVGEHADPISTNKVTQHYQVYVFYVLGPVWINDWVSEAC